MERSTKLPALEWPMVVSAFLFVPALVLEDKATDPLLREAAHIVKWFSKIERGLLARDIFTSVADFGAQDSSIYPALQQDPEADPLGISQPGASK